MLYILKNKYIKICLILAITLVFSTILFLTSIKTKGTTAPANAYQWTNNLILTFNNKNYTVTNETTNNIGRKIGTISYHGNGTVYNLYSINNEVNYEKIAVETKNGYLIAIEKK